MLEPRGAIAVALAERVADPPNADGRWHTLEVLTLWPVQEAGPREPMRFVDVLTDSDGDGVGDVNERLAGTSAEEATETPGVSTIDVLALYDEELREAAGGNPFTRIHHAMVVANTIYRDSGTNITLRTVGMREVEWNERGRATAADELSELFGADVTVEFHDRRSANWTCGGAGCAFVGGHKQRGAWNSRIDGGGTTWAAVLGYSATTAAHELGHVMGLVHSARQGEADGTFRWSRGHYLVDAAGRKRGAGTIMSYGRSATALLRFSDPGSDCLGSPCGVPADRSGGADAVASLNLVRFQVAAHRPSQPDSDHDGFVDPGDPFPRDPNEWMDTDGDGEGDNADPDDDDDGVPDTEDAFPFDLAEWEDADRDGIGDNVDDDIVDLAPFRDPALRAVVEEALDKAPGDAITVDDLAVLKTLDGDFRGDIVDLTGLESASNLETLRLWDNVITDISPLSGLSTLRSLNLSGNPIADLSPLGELTGLRSLGLRGVSLSDLSPLAGLTGLRFLDVAENAVSDLTPLVGLTGLYSLNLTENALTDLSPLADLTGLSELHLTDNNVSDLSPLSNLSLRALSVGYNKLSLQDILALPHYRDLVHVDVRGMGIDDISPLSEMRSLQRLVLNDNSIADVSPLAGWTGLNAVELLWNRVSDIGPLAVRSVWAEGGSNYVLLTGNPLDAASVNEHIPTLESWGIYVGFLVDQVAIPDPVLRALIAQAVAGGTVYVDSAITHGQVLRVRTLRAFGAGVSDLTGLEAAANLEYLFLGSNAVVELGTLSNLVNLTGVDLSNNDVVDVSPLVDNFNFGAGDWVTLNGNPLSEASLNAHVPNLLALGVLVGLDVVRVPVVGIRSLNYAVEGYFAAILGPGPEITVTVGDPALATAEIVGGVLSVVPAGEPGTVTLTVTGTDANGHSATLSFEVTFGVVASGERTTLPVWLFPGASDGAREGFVRVVNHSVESGEVFVEAVDDFGVRTARVRIALAAGQTVSFNSADLEDGNTEKGFSAGVGPGQGDWRLEIESDLDIEVLSYIRTSDGFVTSMHDTVPLAEDGSYRVAFFNPGSNLDQVSHLRLVNPGTEDAEASVSAMDDSGVSAGGTVRVPIPAGASVALTAAELESGMGLDGALGDGSGKWRLAMTSDRPLIAMSLLESPTGHLTNLSTVSTGLTSEDRVDTVPLFLSGSDPLGRQGLVRVENRSDVAGTVRIDAFDDTDRSYQPVTLVIGAHEARPFNSDDIELGGMSKGLTGSTGAGQGDWRLELTSELDVDVLSYIRTPDGFVTSMHESAPVRDNTHRVAFFNPGSNVQQVSTLRLVNREDGNTTATITGVDDAGALGGPVLVVVPARRTVELTAAQLEQGGEGVAGQLGDGFGKWRLQVESNGPLTVMSVLESPTGHLANLSTAPGRGALTGPAANDIADSSIPDPTLRDVVRRALGKDPGARISAADMASLTVLDAEGSGVQELTGLELATGLSELRLGFNAISDLSPLKGLTALETLVVDWNEVSDLSALAGLTNLHTLYISGNEISDLRPLEGLTGLGTLSASYNEISDLAPLSGLTGLRFLFLTGNSVADLSPLSALALWGLTVGYNDVSFEDVLALTYYRELIILGVRSLGIDDISALSELSRPQSLWLDGNSITDVSPLAGLVGLRTVGLDGNAVSDIAPLVAQPIWESAYHSIDQSTLWLRGNPLSPESLDEHVPQLRSWGLNVYVD